MYFVCIIVHIYAKGSTSSHQNVGCCWWIRNSFLLKQSDTGLVKLCSKDLPNCSLFSAAPGPPTRGVESRKSPQAPRVGSSVPTLSGTCRVPGESFRKGHTFTALLNWSHFLCSCSVLFINHGIPL